MRSLGQSVLKLLIGNHLVFRPTDRQTDRPTDRPTCAKQYTPLFSKGGIIIFTSINVWECSFKGCKTLLFFAFSCLFSWRFKPHREEHPIYPSSLNICPPRFRRWFALQFEFYPTTFSCATRNDSSSLLYETVMLDKNGLCRKDLLKWLISWKIIFTSINVWECSFKGCKTLLFFAFSCLFSWRFKPHREEHPIYPSSLNICPPRFRRWFALQFVF